MAQLSDLVGRFRTPQLAEQNLEQGKIYVYYTGTHDANFCNMQCWKAPCSGTVVLEAWGASGSGSRMCCCGIGLPGNPGAYARKTFRVNSNSWVCLYPGNACGNASALCFRGCSVATCLTICSTEMSTPCVCICAQGGMAGLSLCLESCSPVTRYAGCNMCYTQIGSTGCGVICNYGTTFNWQPQAYGGDYNCGGGFSCLITLNCNACCGCYFTAAVRTAAGVFGDKQQTFYHKFQPNGNESGWSNGVQSYFLALAGMQHTPTMGQPFYECFMGSQYCGCYEYQGCHVMAPTGVPGYGGYTCAGIRDHAMRGGHGAVKIKFIAD